MPWLPWRKKTSRDELAEARAARESAEQRFEAAQPVVIKLRELRQKNHVTELLNEIVQRRSQE